MSTVNKDYIGVIKNVNGCVRFVKEEIQQKTALVNELKAMVENPNRTVLDLQSRMDREFIPSLRAGINYVSPYSYSSSYVSGVSYPKAPSCDEYREELQKKRQEYTKTYEERYESLKEDNIQEFNSKVNECVERDVNSLVERMKKDFYAECTRFCQAYSYMSLLRELKSDPDVKMWTTDNVGWTNLSYSITDDIRIDVHTNFGYGWSSYFYLGLTYKDIDILPYSFCVKYYYADYRDIARYTRLYATEHESWDYAFYFVEDTARKAAEGDETFATGFVMNEVQEMLEGLRHIIDDPKSYLDKFASSKNPDNESHYLSVRNMSSSDKSTYAAYPHEMVDVFQAEKISGALEFLEKISALEPIYKQANEAADEIRSLAQGLLPRIEENMARIASDIERLQAEEDDLTTQVEALDLKIGPHITKIDALYETKFSAAKEDERVYRYDIEKEYSEEHPDYVALVEERNDVSRARSKVRNEKSDRQSFHSRLEQCKKEIESNNEE